VRFHFTPTYSSFTADDVAKAKETIERTSPVEVNVHAAEKPQPAGAV
jgi:hypothetical protein